MDKNLPINFFCVEFESTSSAVPVLTYVHTHRLEDSSLGQFNTMALQLSRVNRPVLTWIGIKNIEM